MLVSLFYPCYVCCLTVEKWKTSTSDYKKFVHGGDSLRYCSKVPCFEPDLGQTGVSATLGVQRSNWSTVGRLHHFVVCSLI